MPQTDSSVRIMDEPKKTIVQKRTRITSHQALWLAQWLLAALFLFAGIGKLAQSPDTLTDIYGLPGPFMKFIAACEVMGALGLVLPGITRIRTGLIPLAALGLVVIMAGAVGDTIVVDGNASVIVPLVPGVVAAAVAYARGRQWRAARSPEGATAAVRPAVVH